MNIDTIAEASHEGMSTRSSKLSTPKFVSPVAIERLKRENEHLKAISDESAQTRQTREQLEQLNLERKKRIASSMASSSVHHPSKFPPPLTAPSEGTLEELYEKLKREIEMLRASRSNAPSERSKKSYAGAGEDEERE